MKTNTSNIFFIRFITNIYFKTVKEIQRVSKIIFHLINTINKEENNFHSIKYVYNIIIFFVSILMQTCHIKRN